MPQEKSTKPIVTADITDIVSATKCTQTLVGMFLHLGALQSFEEAELRIFLHREISKSRHLAFLKGLFKTHRRKDLLYRCLRFLQEKELLRAFSQYKKRLSVRRFDRDPWERFLTERGFLPRHKRLVQGLAKRFENMLSDIYTDAHTYQSARDVIRHLVTWELVPRKDIERLAKRVMQTERASRQKFHRDFHHR